MKKLLYILLIFPLFIACSNDDEEEPFDITPLIGKWQQNKRRPLSSGRSSFEFYPDTTFTYKSINPSETTTSYNRHPFTIRGNGIYIYDYSPSPMWVFKIVDSENIHISGAYWEDDPFDEYSLHSRIK